MASYSPWRQIIKILDMKCVTLLKISSYWLDWLTRCLQKVENQTVSTIWMERKTRLFNQVKCKENTVNQVSLLYCIEYCNTWYRCIIVIRLTVNTFCTDHVWTHSTLSPVLKSAKQQQVICVAKNNRNGLRFQLICDYCIFCLVQRDLAYPCGKHTLYGKIS